MSGVLLAHPVSAGADGWVPLVVLLGGFAAVVGALVAAGRPGSVGGARARFLARIPNGLERATRIPGWAAATAGTALFGLLVAGIGFYEDVAWHIAYGRDEELFTPPHTMIVVGLGLIALAGVLGVVLATVTGARARVHLRGVQLPWSALLMGLLGGSALVGFPLDEAWHRAYGIDVTMWSPTHLLMIVGASLSPLASWLVLSEAGVRASDGPWCRAAHVLTAWLTLAGLSSVQGEFAFGVPQYQQLYLPVLVLLAGGAALTATRLVLGRGWAVGVALLSVIVDVGGVMNAGDASVDVRRGAVYLGSAVAVELVAWVFGTERPTRFAVASAVGVSTLGLGTEWWWNTGAHQPWTAALLPDALVLGVLAAFGAAVLGTVLGTAIRHEVRRVPGWLIGLAAAAVLVALIVPFPRRVGDVRAELTLDGPPERTQVRVTLSPPDAAAEARWFQAIAWQGGDLVVAEMREAGGATYVSERPIPAGGSWKSLVRLHRGAEMMTLPVYMPPDPEIGWPGVTATDRRDAFRGEQRYLMPEVTDGQPGFARFVYALVAVVAALWVFGFAWVSASVRHGPPVRSAPHDPRDATKVAEERTR